jgi:prepilin-type N-terminal cleavage/methylation domain-containing protein
MHKGHTLLELLVVLTIAGICLAVAAPLVTDVLDWIAADGAAHDVTMAFAIARQEAVLAGQATRVLVTADSLVIDRRDSGVWLRWRRFPGPATRGVSLEVSNPEVVFSALGAGWGASNTTVMLNRGRRQERITTSRVGRVKRW